MADYTWVGYAGAARIWLAAALLVVAVAVAYAGLRLPLPFRAPRRSESTVAIMVGAWLAAIVAFLVCVSAYVQQAIHDHPGRIEAPRDPITPITFSCVAIIFVVVLAIGRRRTWPVRLVGAAIAAMAAPMIFELPFDLIVMSRSYPPLAPDPTAYRVLFFAPLFLVELTTLAFLILTPMVTFRREAVWCFTSILVVFAVWALYGFGYPTTPVFYTMNVASKILAFVTALVLFLPAPTSRSATRPGGQDPAQYGDEGHQGDLPRSARRVGRPPRPGHRSRRAGEHPGVPADGDHRPGRGRLCCREGQAAGSSATRPRTSRQTSSRSSRSRAASMMRRR